MPFGARFPQVLSAAAEGADWAWAELYRDLGPPLLRFLAAQGAREPEDLLAEVFIDVVRNLPSFEGQEPEFRAWVFRIARNRHIDAWRAERRRPRAAAALHDEEPEAHGSDPPADAAILERAAIQEVLGTLTIDQRAVLLLRYIHQFSVEDTASILGRSPGAVRVLQHRALHSLRRTLGTGKRTQPKQGGAAPEGGEPPTLNKQSITRT